MATNLHHLHAAGHRVLFLGLACLHSADIFLGRNHGSHFQLIPSFQTGIELGIMESVDHLCDKCKSYAANWQPTADEIWSHTKIRESRYENYKDWKPNQQ